MAKKIFLDFEQSIAELENKIDELRYVQTESAVDISSEIDQLAKKSLQLTKDVYSQLTPWQITKIARHAERPVVRAPAATIHHSRALPHSRRPPPAARGLW